MSAGCPLPAWPGKVTVAHPSKGEMVFGERRWRAFWAHVEPAPGPCWWWSGHRGEQGYGRWFTTKANRSVAFAAHRLAYQLVVGPIPDGLTLDHLCRNRACVRPGDLEPVTGGVNTLRGDGATARNAAKTHCINGHEFDAANTYRRANRRGCRACARDRRRRTRAAAA